MVTSATEQGGTRRRQRTDRLDDPILASKITIPELPGWVVARPRIEKQIAEGVFLLGLAAALAGQDPPLVLDDLHLLTDPPTLAGLGYVLRNARSGLRDFDRAASLLHKAASLSGAEDTAG